MRPRIIIIGLALLAILVFGAVFVFFQGKGGQNNSQATAAYRLAGDKFMGYMTSTNASAAYAMLSEAMKAQNSEDQWSRDIGATFQGFTGKAEFKSLGTFRNENFYKAGSDPHMLVYDLTIKGNKWRTSFVIFKEQGTWRVDDLQSYRL